MGSASCRLQRLLTSTTASLCLGLTLAAEAGDSKADAEDLEAKVEYWCSWNITPNLPPNQVRSSCDVYTGCQKDLAQARKANKYQFSECQSQKKAAHLFAWNRMRDEAFVGFYATTRDCELVRGALKRDHDFEQVSKCKILSFKEYLRDKDVPTKARKE
jgi:hypothetical protein